MTTVRISADMPQAYEFACHSKACAPPPAGRGGSIPGGGKTTFVSKYGTPSVTNGTPKVVRAKKSDPMAKFMAKMAKKAREDYWGPKGPPEGRPLFSSLKD